MKKTLLLSIFASLIYAQELQMPPSMPMLDMKKQDSKKQTKTKKMNSCEAIPPMIHMLPPPLQSAVDTCQNEKFMPKKEQVVKYLKKNKIAYKSIEIKPAKDFVRVYNVTLGNGKTLFCNEKVTRCVNIK